MGSRVAGHVGRGLELLASVAGVGDLQAGPVFGVWSAGV